MRLLSTRKSHLVFPSYDDKHKCHLKNASNCFAITKVGMIFFLRFTNEHHFVALRELVAK